MNNRLSSDLIAARTCYSHLAGELGIVIASALEKHRYLQVSRQDKSMKYILTESGKAWSQKLGIGSRGRVQIQPCMDYSHQIPHIAGAWPVDFCKFLFHHKYLLRGNIGRSFVVTTKGDFFLG